METVRKMVPDEIPFFNSQLLFISSWYKGVGTHALFSVCLNIVRCYLAKNLDFVYLIFSSTYTFNKVQTSMKIHKTFVSITYMYMLQFIHIHVTVYIYIQVAVYTYMLQLKHVHVAVYIYTCCS